MKRRGAKLRKALRLLRRTQLIRAALLHQIAAAVEHFPVIRQTRAATLVDVGANKGQFSLAFRTAWPEAEIIAFEPLGSEADRFERLFRKDARTSLIRVALSDREGEAEFHIASRADSSSLLMPGQGQADAFGVMRTRTARVRVARLDTCLDLSNLAKPILLKIDVQGAELAVLEGCDALGEVDFIYVELSFVELYEKQPLFNDVVEYLDGRGFIVAGEFNPVETQRFGKTQADFLFRRAPSVAPAGQS